MMENDPTPLHLSAIAFVLAVVPLLIGQTYGPPSGGLERTPVQLLDMNRASGAEAKPGEVVVAAAPGVTRSRIARRAEALDCRLASQMGNRPLFVVRCDPAVPIENLLRRWWHSSGAHWVEASYYETDEREPNDLDDSQWHHKNDGQVIDESEGIAGADIDTPAAWELHTGSAEVVIAPIDSGLYEEHQDLRDRLWTNDDETCDSGFDDDGNGYVDDCRGWDAGEYHNDPTPHSLPEEQSDGDTCIRWHGSVIGGLAGAAGDNGVGVAGVGWNVRLMNLKRHADTCNSASASSMAASAYAIDNGADILVMSYNSSAYSRLYEQILQEGDRRGVVFAMSAGNGGEDSDDMRRFPNNYKVRNQLVAANTNNRDELYSTSNWGEANVDLAAPGTDVRGPGIGAPDEYRTRTGTSYSAPVVAGAAAVVMSAFPNLSAADVVDAIVTGVEPLSNLDCDVTDTCVASGGRLDVRGALREAARRATPARLVDRGLEVSPETDASLAPGEGADIRVAIGNEGGDADGVTARLRPVAETADEVTLVRREVAFGTVLGGTRRVEADEPLQFEVDEGCSGGIDAELAVEVRDETGYGYTRSLEWTFDCAIDGDDDGVERPADCDDADPEVHPGAGEYCDGTDTNCNGLVDENAVDRQRWWPDEDDDGFGESEGMTLACVRPSGSVANGDDCDDSAPDVYPGATGWSLECDRMPAGSADPDASDGCGCTTRRGAGPFGFWALLILFGAAFGRRFAGRG